MGMESWVKGATPFAVMVMVECGEVGMVTLSKAAMNKGMSNFVFVVYYNALGTLILLPFFIFHRLRIKPPPVTFPLLCRFSLLGLIGICLVQICAYTGINYSSPVLATALGNLIPAFTFLLAISFRMEKLDMRRGSSQAKSMGTIVAILGAFVMTFYEGPSLLNSAASTNPFDHHLLLQSHQPNWALGGLFIVITCLMSSTWNIVQTATIKEYSDEVTIVFFYCCFGTIECAIFSLLAERNASAWMLRSGIELVAIVFAAVFGTVFRSSALTWCLNKKGPVFVAMFKPTQMVISVIMGVMFLGDTLHLGSVIGGAIIAIGFYTVMWGQAKEKAIVVKDNPCLEEQYSHHAPLLQNNTFRQEA